MHQHIHPLLPGRCLASMESISDEKQLFAVGFSMRHNHALEPWTDWRQPACPKQQSRGQADLGFGRIYPALMYYRSSGRPLTLKSSAQAARTLAAIFEGKYEVWISRLQ
jgi:hypothetical protein